MNIEQKIAQELIKIGAVKFVSDHPVTFKSGIISPIYVDNREFPFHPDSWSAVISGFQDKIKSENLEFDVVAGVAVAGIPHSAALGFATKKPSIFIRKEAKDHGTKSLVEGGNIEGKKVLLIEDLVSTGGSSLNAVREIRKAGGIVEDALVIVSYDFKESKANFENEKVKLHALTSFPVILEEASSLGVLNGDQTEKIKEWLIDPYNWNK